MGRRIWIIPRKDKVELADFDDAKLANCPEIVNGIPPKLQGVIREQDLPMAFEEPKYPSPPEPRDLVVEIDTLTTELVDKGADITLLQGEVQSLTLGLAGKSAEIDNLEARIEKLEK